MSTFAMDSAENRKLYDLGLQDYAAQRIALLQFLGQNV